VYFAGHSAGAHLVAKLIANVDFLDSTIGAHRLQGVFLISGVYDLRQLIHTTVNDALQLPREWAVPLSPQFDNYSHLFSRRVRIYILAGENESPTFKQQSRAFYDHLLNVCMMRNMYLEIKDNMDHFNIVESVVKENNYLKNLLVHDIGKHL
jgi:arylformamidase